MAQTAMVVPGFALETPKTSKLDGVKGAFAALTDFEWPKLSLPELNRGFKDFNDIETPAVLNLRLLLLEKTLSVKSVVFSLKDQKDLFGQIN